MLSSLSGVTYLLTYFPDTGREIYWLLPPFTALLTTSHFCSVINKKNCCGSFCSQHSFKETPFYDSLPNDCQFLLSPLAFSFIPTWNAPPLLLRALLIEHVAKVMEFISVLISTHFHCRVMHIHRPNLCFSLKVLIGISFFTAEATHLVCVPVYSWRAVFPLSCGSFFSCI